MIYLRNNFCINKTFFRDEINATALKEITNGCGFDEFDSADIYCEDFHYFIPLEICSMKNKTVINATNFVVADLRDEEVGGITFNQNKAIEYLPYKVYMQFPNLVDYWADSCSVKQISRENFQKLNRLQLIWLASNKIQKISGNTFHGLENLSRVDLSEFPVGD